MPRQPPPRVTIRISAELTDLDDVEDLEEYYCLDEVWDWDDDTESEYGPDCDPYEEGMELTRRFRASHQFSVPGTYTIWLRLQRNGETVIAGNVKVMIRGADRGIHVWPKDGDRSEARGRGRARLPWN